MRGGVLVLAAVAFIGARTGALANTASADVGITPVSVLTESGAEEGLAFLVGLAGSVASASSSLLSITSIEASV